MKDKERPRDSHALALDSVRDAAIRFLAAIGPKQDDPSPPPELRAAMWRYLAAIGPKQDDPHQPQPPPPDELRAVLAHTRTMIEAIGPKQDDPIKRAIYAGAVARFAEAIGPKQDDPHAIGPKQDDPHAIGPKQDDPIVPPRPADLTALHVWMVKRLRA